jgi:hypothetical protein
MCLTPARPTGASENRELDQSDPGADLLLSVRLGASVEPVN